MMKAKCSVKECSNQVLAIKNPNLCWTHYKRLKKRGSTEDQFINKGKKCNVDGCEKDSYVKGLCKGHRNRQLKYGDPLAGRSNSTKGQICTFSECCEPVRTSGLCRNHYANFIYRKQRYGINIKQYLERGIQKTC